jgi:hypothetical protein
MDQEAITNSRRQVRGIAPKVAEKLGNLEAAALAHHIASAISHFKKPYYHTAKALRNELPFLSVDVIGDHVRRFQQHKVLSCVVKKPTLATPRQYVFSQGSWGSARQVASETGAFRYYLGQAVEYGLLTAVLINNIGTLLARYPKRIHTDANGVEWAKIMPAHYEKELGKAVHRRTVTRALDDLSERGLLQRLKISQNTYGYRLHPGLSNGGIVPNGTAWPDSREQVRLPPTTGSLAATAESPKEEEVTVASNSLELVVFWAGQIPRQLSDNFPEQSDKTPRRKREMNSFQNSESPPLGDFQGSQA